jgi:hypothetical protein
MPQALVRTYLRTLWLIRYSLLTIACMLALGYVTCYPGADATLGLAFARPRAPTTEILRYVFLPQSGPGLVRWRPGDIRGLCAAVYGPGPVVRANRDANRAIEQKGRLPGFWLHCGCACRGSVA